MSDKPTRRQLECLRGIDEIGSAQGYPPTVGELCAWMNLASRSTAHAHVSALAEKGLVERGRGARAMRITEAGRAALRGLEG